MGLSSDCSVMSRNQVYVCWEKGLQRKEFYFGPMMYFSNFNLDLVYFCTFPHCSAVLYVQKCFEVGISEEFCLILHGKFLDICSKTVRIIYGHCRITKFCCKFQEKAFDEISLVVNSVILPNICCQSLILWLKCWSIQLQVKLFWKEQF